MTREEVEKIVARDMPGWRLCANAKIPEDTGQPFLVWVTNNERTSAALISEGKASGPHFY